MTVRRILFGLAVLAACVLIGLPASRLFFRERAPEPPPVLAAQPQASAATVEPVRLGPTEVDEVETGDAPDWQAFNRQTRNAASRALQAVVYILSETGTTRDGYTTEEAGSGIIITPTGYVLTNSHVVERAQRTSVLLDDGRQYSAEVVASDPSTDLAVLRLLEVGVGGDAPLPVATLGDSDDLSVGDWVLTVGNPFGLNGTVTSGIVSALGRGGGGLDVIRNDLAVQDFIQTDAAINSGNSGGALVDFRGNVVGVVTAIASESGQNEGYGFAIPSNLASHVAEDLIAYGRRRSGYLGVDVTPITSADARERGMPRVQGVLVLDVARGGSAARAGVRPGDVLLSVAGRPIDGLNQFQSRLAQTRPGETLRLGIWRGGAEIDLRAALVSETDPALAEWFATRESDPTAPPLPADEPIQRSEATDWGVRFRDLTASERRQFGVPSGAIVERVEPNSAADLDGLPTGAVVVEIEGRPVTSASEARSGLARQARRDEPALLRVRRQDGLTAFYDLASPFLD